jgi:arylsulfatase A-like enzyme
MLPYCSNLIVFFGVLFATAYADEPTKNKKPNILLVLADDVGTGDIPSYWDSSVVDMPNIDRLAKMGVTFKDAHSTPLCAPSRYMLLSGNYAHRGFRPNGSWGFYEDRNQFLDHQTSIAEVLRDAGYHTGIFGKWHLGAKAPPNGVPRDKDIKVFEKLLSSPEIDWSLPLIEGPADIGFDRSYITTSGIQAPPYSFFRDGYLTTNTTDVRFWDRGAYSMPHGMSKIQKHPGEGDKDWDSSAYNMILVNETTKFIDEHLDENLSQPFFAYVALGAVHIPHSPPYRYLDGSRVRKEYPTRHLDMLFEMDKVAGSLISMIEEKQLGDDTIIIFTSDNGGLRNNSQKTGHRISGPLRGEKGMIYEGGHRVPLIMRYDNHFPANETREELVGLNDIYATICELIGVDIPYRSAQDSISFADYVDPSISEGPRIRRTNIATWVNTNNRVKQESIRFGSFKLIHNAHDATFELYDLENDISETNNLSWNEEYADKIDDMYTKLKADGPCPDDREGKFPIEGMNNPKGCRWFRNDTNRCKRHLEGELYCHSVCGHNQQLC